MRWIGTDMSCHVMSLLVTVKGDGKNRLGGGYEFPITSPPSEGSAC